MERITAIIISFLRPEYTKECIRSLKKRYDKINILVAENGEYSHDMDAFVRIYGGEYMMMPFDSGVCYARNRLVEAAKTEYVLVGDDDFYYNQYAGVEKMLDFMDRHPEVPLIGGKIYEDGKLLDYQGDMVLHHDHIEYIPLEDADCVTDWGAKIRYGRCDITFNYFLGRREIIESVKWDENIKVAYEHSDWFLSLKKAGIGKVAYTPDAVAIHKPRHVAIKNEDLEKYRRFRCRKSDMDYFFKKHGITYTVGFKGHVSKASEVKEHKREWFATKCLEFDGRFYNPGDIIITNHPVDGMEQRY